MSQSYVGIATPAGLELFVPENGHVIRFLLRRAYRSNRTQAVCFWAVMDEAIADAVRALLRTGCRQDALLVIQTLAIEAGSICPEQRESSALIAG